MNKKIILWLMYHVALLIFSIIAAMIMKYNQTGKAFVPETILVAATIFTMSALIGYLAVYIKNKGAKLSHQELNKKIVPVFIVFLACTIAIANFVVSLGALIWYLVKGLDLNTFLPNLYKHELSYANKSLSFWLLFISIVFFYALWQKSIKLEQSLREETLKYKYRNLKSHVNPHFLFNSLNTLSEIVYIDAKKADNYIQKLSGIYRYILDNEETDLILLKEELEFVKQYFSLQKERDDDKISLKIECQHSEGYKIIPVSLQLLVENALKHNSMSQENPLEIQIYCGDEYVVVSNTLQRKNIIESSAQTGLENLKERVQLIMGKEIIVSEDNKKFTVRLPIIRA